MSEPTVDLSNLIKDSTIAESAAVAEKPFRDAATDTRTTPIQKESMLEIADRQSEDAIEAELRQQFLDKDWLSEENHSLVDGKMSVDQVRNALKPALGRNLDTILHDKGLSYDQKVTKITGMTKLLNQAVGLEMRGPDAHGIANLYRDTYPQDGGQVLEMVFALALVRGEPGKAMSALVEASGLLGVNTAELVERNLSIINETYHHLEDEAYQPLDANASAESHNAKVNANQRMQTIESSLASVGFEIRERNWVRRETPQSQQ